MITGQLGTSIVMAAIGAVILAAILTPLAMQAPRAANRKDRAARLT